MIFDFILPASAVLSLEAETREAAEHEAARVVQAAADAAPLGYATDIVPGTGLVLIFDGAMPAKLLESV